MYDIRFGLSSRARVQRREKSKAPFGPILLGFFAFVVIGQPLLSVIQRVFQSGVSLLRRAMAAVPALSLSPLARLLTPPTCVPQGKGAVSED